MRKAPTAASGETCAPPRRGGPQAAGGPRSAAAATRKGRAKSQEIELPDWPSRNREETLRLGDYRHVAGVDEVGRGALAGPVVAAAVVLPEKDCPEGINDSKLLTQDQREALFHQIMHCARAVSVYLVGPETIDSINILQASNLALRRATLSLSLNPDIALLDGLPVKEFPCCSEAIIKGDRWECCIAAASIVAKVTRDRLMEMYSVHYPEYGFHSNRGYSTLSHVRAISLHGLSPIHRRSFTPRRMEGSPS